MAPELTFGPPDDQWHYVGATKTFDLTRGASAGSFTVATTQGHEETRITVAPSRSALVVVDMQNYFLHPDCRDHRTGLASVDPTLEVIAKCREVGIQIIWLNWGLSQTDLDKMPASYQRTFSGNLIAGAWPPPGAPSRYGLGADLGNGQGRTLVAGEWNSAIFEPLAAAVRSDDVHCAKNRMSGLWSPEQPLFQHLKAAGTRTLFFAGVNTDQCVLGTLTDAYSNGWDCVLVDDCCGTTSPGAREVVLYNVAGCYGFVVDSKTITAAKVA